MFLWRKYKRLHKKPKIFFRDNWAIKEYNQDKQTVINLLLKENYMDCLWFSYFAFACSESRLSWRSELNLDKRSKRFVWNLISAKQFLGFILLLDHTVFRGYLCSNLRRNERIKKCLKGVESIKILSDLCILLLSLSDELLHQTILHARIRD